MNPIVERALVLHRLHVRGKPLQLCNVWDAGSARAVVAAGAPAVATSSWAIAAACGEDDGERLPWTVMLDTLRRIARSVEVPVSADIEAGYAECTDSLASVISDLLNAGVVGCNIEDGLPGKGELRCVDEQSERLQTVRRVADAEGVSLFVNARTDVFMLAAPEAHAGLVDEALARARRYAAVGANGLFLPGLTDPELIARLAREIELPLNIMQVAGALTVEQAATLGVARISRGPGPWIASMARLKEEAKIAFDGTASKEAA